MANNTTGWPSANGTDSFDNTTQPLSSLDNIAITLDRVCTPIIWIIGFPGNTLSLIVWMQKRMRHSSGYYLAALALNDLLFLALQVLYELESTWQKRVLAYPGVCQIFPSVYLTTQCLSPFFVLAFTTERYISICHPFRRESICTVRRAQIVILIMTCVGFSVNCVNMYFFTLIGDHCMPRPELTADGATSVYVLVATCTDVLYYFVVPLAILILNIMVIWEMRRLSRREPAQQHQSGGQKTGSTTVMLLAVSFYQILTTMPISVVTILHFIYNNNDPQAEFTLAKTIIYEYGITHYAFNIFIYLITGKMFRQELRRMILGPFGKFAPKAAFVSEYSSLRTSVNSPAGKAPVWLNANGKHGKGPATKTSETLL